MYDLVHFYLIGFAVYHVPMKTMRRRPRKAVAREDAARWVKNNLGFEPDEKQRLMLSTGSKQGILNCTRQWGKSFIGAAKAVHQACTEAGSLTLVVSPSARQSGEFVRKAEIHARRLGIQPKGDGDNEISILFPNGSRIVGLPGNQATTRGFSAVALLLIDEAAQVNDEMYASLRPTLATSDGALWLISTPYGRRGFFYDAWANGGDSWERISVPATECARIPAAFLAKERANTSDRNFRQEYLCEFSAMVNGAFDPELVDAAMSDEFEPLVLV